MTTESLKRRLAAIFNADVKGYSRLMREDETATVQRLTAYREAMSTLIEQHHGRVVDSPGDNVLAEFASVVDAVQSAVAIQKEFKSRNAELPDNRKMAFRIGINLGDVIVDGDRIYGDGVNIAARLEALADPGGICLSRTAYDQIEDKLPLGYVYMGEKQVKNIPKPVHAYKVLMEPEEAVNNKPQEEQESRRDNKQQLKHIQIRKRHGRRGRSKERFFRSLRTYVIVIGFLLIINILSYHGKIWFHWLAIVWGFFLVFRYRHGFSEPRKEGEESKRSFQKDKVRMREPGEPVRFLRIEVEPRHGSGKDEEGVDIRVPIGVLRAGSKLGAFIPNHARAKISAALKKKGIDIDLASIDDEKIEELLNNIADMCIEVDGDDGRVRIFSE